MRKSSLVFLLVAFAGGLVAEAGQAGDPIAGIWHGTHTAGGAGYEHYIKITKRGRQYMGIDLTFRGMDSDEAQRAMMKQLRPSALAGRDALCVQQQYLVTWDGTILTFKGLKANPVTRGGRYKPDTFNGPMPTPGIFAGEAVDTQGLVGRFRFWREGALEAARPAPPTAGKTEKLACLDDKDYHYTVYLPKTYDAKKACPVLVSFSPGGNAKPLLPKLADEFGWIMVGLTESKNGPWEPILLNRDAVLFDLHRRFNIDWKRVYFVGFSGGARAASTTACNYPKMTAGLICIGAAYGEGKPPLDIPIFYIVGKTDMNNKEVTGAHKQAVSQKRKAELIVHPGGHTWGRAEDHEAAIRWLEKETAK